ncbi:hypothetical protein [Mesorhizobium sp. 8]|uniref:hypothetical protein n=1 Tax=Mesorhizobium sp. 8 TaxID=2584466 RepID=UPI00111FCF23|nr:hypothetical protein [Mesorhizobium sp. 8]QDC01722.1 hypothetical protein FGU64_15535 [Mesorhizobium sp. 8]
MRILVIIATAIFTLSGPALADGTTKEKWPSIIYYGDGVNNRIDGGLFWEGQAGRLAEDARRQEKSDGHHGPATGYGAISTITNLPRTHYVSGYTRSDGVDVRPYYRSKR